MPILNTKTALLIVLFALLAIPVMAAVPPGRITVYSTPTGALACIDNRDCDTTGATFTAEGNAWHTVVITENGYREWSDKVYVTSDQTSMVSAYLDLDPAATGIRVSVTPGGGTVCLDNSRCRANVTVSAGSTMFTGVSPGYHTILVESPAGYEDTTKLVQVSLGKVTDVSIMLDPSGIPATPAPRINPSTGTIRVYADRTGSTICLDRVNCFVNVGGPPGPGTGTTIFNEVTAGEVHIITVAADGYKPVSVAVTVSQDLITTVDVSLQPAGAVTTVPPVSTLSPVTTMPVMPIPTQSGLDSVAVIGALVLCCAFLLSEKKVR